jgi:DNA-binding MarR family transcriptional regulator
MPDRQDVLTTLPEEPDLAILLVGAGRALADRLARDHAAAGDELRPAHGFVVRALHRSPLALTDLAAQLGISKQAVAVVVDEMVAHGYAERRADPGDGRRKLIALTTRGEAIRERALRTSAAIERELAGELGEDAVKTLRAALLLFLERHGGAEDARARRARPVW